MGSSSSASNLSKTIRAIDLTCETTSSASSVPHKSKTYPVIDLTKDNTSNDDLLDSLTESIHGFSLSNDSPEGSEAYRQMGWFELSAYNERKHVYNYGRQTVWLPGGRDKNVAKLLGPNLYFLSGYLRRPHHDRSLPAEFDKLMNRLRQDITRAKTELKVIALETLAYASDDMTFLDGVELMSPTSVRFRVTNKLMATVAKIKMLENMLQVVKANRPGPETGYDPYTTDNTRTFKYVDCAELSVLITAICIAVAVPEPDTIGWASHAELQAIAYYISRQPSLSSILRISPPGTASAVLDPCRIQISKTAVCESCQVIIHNLMQAFRFELEIFGPDKEPLLMYDTTGIMAFKAA